MTPIIFPVLVVAGLIIPGWLVARILRCQVGILGYFLISAAVLFNLLLALDIIAGGFHPSALLITYLVLMIGLFLLGNQKAPQNIFPEHLSARCRLQNLHWLLAPAGIGLLAIGVKAIYAPLSGFDTVFRWDHLAHEMFLRRNWDFYPPISANDFLKYPWCDGIAPLISSLYYWIYLSSGDINRNATAIIVVGQGLLLYYSVHALASSRGGIVAGYAAVAVLSTSAVFLSGVAMGQETGMTALSLIAMFLYIERYRMNPAGNWLVVAGLAGGLGGLAREYGVIYFLLGACALVPLGISRRDWLKFIGSAFFVMGPWYLRNWIITGHPMYSYDLGRLFPVNPVHTEYMRATRAIFSLFTFHDAPFTLFSLVLRLAGIPLLLAFTTMLWRARSLWPWSFGLLITAGLWLWTAGQTAGGHQYSLRVLTPTLAIAACLAGVLLASAPILKYIRVVAVLLVLPAVDAAQRSLYMPINPTIAWWNEHPLGWREQRRQADQWESLKSWDLVVDAVEHRTILVNDPWVWAMLHHRGARITPIFSPQVRFLFESDAKLEPSIHRLRAAGFRFILLSRVDYVSKVQLSRVPFFRALNAVSPTANLPFGDIYDLYAPEFLSAVSPQPPGPRP